MYITTSFLSVEGMPKKIHERIAGKIKCGAVGGIMPANDSSYLSTIFFNATQESVNEALLVAIESGCTVQKLPEQAVKKSKDSNVSFAEQAYSILPPKRQRT